MRKNMLIIARDFSFIVALGFLSAAGLELFVFSNTFAPAGVDGIAAMVQSATGIDAAYVSLAINLPLLIIGWFCIHKKYVTYTVIFIIANSVFLLVWNKLNINLPDGERMPLLDALFAGLTLGFRAGMLLYLGGSSGGLDIMVNLLQRKFERFDFEKLLFVLNSIIIAVSFFVYGESLYSILLAIVYCFVYSRTVGLLLQGPQSALECKIVTDHPEQLTQCLISELKHGVTIVRAEGGFTGSGYSLLFCVINRREVTRFKKLVSGRRGTFAYVSAVNNVYGNFRRGRNELPR